MRLTPHEVEAIKDCARAHFGEGAVVRLFGSRVRDDLRGGDIDLHIIAEADDRVTSRQESSFLDALMRRIGEQRIDLIARRPREDFEAIDNVAALTGVILQRGKPDLWREPTMTLDGAQARMMTNAVVGGRRVSARLEASLHSLGPLLSFNGDALSRLDDERLMQVDSLLLLFMNMVSIVQGQLIRTVVRTSGQDVGGMMPIDFVNAAEKLGAWPPSLDVKTVVEARNRLAHQYPHDPVRQAALVNQIAEAAPLALAAFRRLDEYVAERHPEAAGC